MEAMEYGWLAYEINLNPMDTEHLKESNRTPLEEKLNQLEEWRAEEVETKLVALGNKWQPPRVLVTAKVPFDECVWGSCTRRKWGNRYSGKWACPIHQKALDSGLNPDDCLTLDSLGLENRTISCLRKARIDKVETLIRWGPKDLCQIRNFGNRCLQDVRHGLAKVGLTLNEDAWDDEEEGEDDEP